MRVWPFSYAALCLQLQSANIVLLRCCTWFIPTVTRVRSRQSYLLGGPATLLLSAQYFNFKSESVGLGIANYGRHVVCTTDCARFRESSFLNLKRRRRSPTSFDDCKQVARRHRREGGTPENIPLALPAPSSLPSFLIRLKVLRRRRRQSSSSSTTTRIFAFCTRSFPHSLTPTSS